MGNSSISNLRSAFKLKQFSRKYLSIPYGVFMVMFIILPLVILFLYAFTERKFDGSLTLNFTIANFKEVFSPTNLDMLERSFKIGIISTLACLIIGYPIALILSRSTLKHKNVIVMLFMLPMWVNFLIRTLATKAVFEAMDIKLGEFSVTFTMIYNYLPYMIMPIYNVIEKIDNCLHEGARDLGANEFTVLRKVTVPLSLPGILSGITMVFMPSITTFAIANIMSNNTYILVGDYIYSESFISFNVASAISLIILVVIGISMAIVNKYDKDGNAQGGMM